MQVEFGQPYTARELVLRLGLAGDQVLHGSLEASTNGRSFNLIREFDAEASRLVADSIDTTAW